MSPLARKLAARLPAGARRRAKRALARGHDLRCRWSSKRAGLALCYHAVGDPPGDPERELVPPLGTREFEAQLRHLRARYRLVRASELLPAVRGRRRGQRFPVAVTFDDDLGSHLGEAAPVLGGLGVPATFFLCGASLREPHRFWWERLQQAWDADALEPARMQAWGVQATAERPRIRDAAAAIQALSPSRREAVAAELERLVGEDPPSAGMPAGEVVALAAAGFEVGFHTIRHDALPALGDEELEGAMRDGAAELAEAAGGELGTVSYPHGLGDERVARAARAAGFRFGFTALGRPVLPHDDPLLLDRCYPSPGSLADFELEIARRVCRGSR